MTPDELWESFRPRAVEGSDRPRGEEFFVDCGTAAEMIETSTAHGFAVIGLDDFLYETEKLMPKSYGYDASRQLAGADWDEICRCCNGGTRKFLDDAAASGANLFTVVIVGREAWGKPFV